MFTQINRKIRIIILMNMLINCTLLAIESEEPVFKNPVFRPNLGATDPHIKIFNNKAYMYATHDYSINNTCFVMKDWWIWSSDDLINWKKECVIKPEDYYIGPLDSCWAVDAEYKKGYYYLYVSAGPSNIAVLKSPSPVGPWTAPLNHHLIAEGTVPTEPRDPAIFTDDNGDSYILFGVWNFYIAKLNDDMISFTEKPQLISIVNPKGPYNIDGSNKSQPTDDKVDIHKYKGKYYLSWGCFYAMSDNLYGPYDCKGAFFSKQSVSPMFRKNSDSFDIYYDRHGKFFEFDGQWYFACNDQSQPDSHGTFRNTVICQVNYNNNGEIEPLCLDEHWHN